MRRLISIVVIAGALLGFILYLVLDLHWLPESFLDHTPAWVGWVVLFCVLCYVYSELAGCVVRKPKDRASAAKPKIP